MNLGHLLLVGAGGFLGSSLRYAVSMLVQRAWPAFPAGTLAVNVTGCLLIGVLGGLADTRQLMDGGARLFWMVGVLGGYTTFSAFALDTLALTGEGQLGRAFINIAAQVLLGLGAAFAGYILVRSM